MLWRPRRERRGTERLAPVEPPSVPSFSGKFGPCGVRGPSPPNPTLKIPHIRAVAMRYPMGLIYARSSTMLNA